MPIYDFECGSCGAITERYAKIADEVLACEKCASDAYRIISVSGQYLGNQAAPWLESVLEVVDKDPTKPHCVEFRKNPTRANWKSWMKGEGIKPAPGNHHGGPPTASRPELPSMDRVHQEVWDKHRKRMSIEI